MFVQNGIKTLRLAILAVMRLAASVTAPKIKTALFAEMTYPSLQEVNATPIALPMHPTT